MSIGLGPFDSVLVDFEHFNHSWISYQRNANANCVSARKSRKTLQLIPGRKLLSLRNFLTCLSGDVRLLMNDRVIGL